MHLGSILSYYNCKTSVASGGCTPDLLKFYIYATKFATLYRIASDHSKCQAFWLALTGFITPTDRCARQCIYSTYLVATDKMPQQLLQSEHLIEQYLGGKTYSDSLSHNVPPGTEDCVPVVFEESYSELKDQFKSFYRHK